MSEHNYKSRLKAFYDSNSTVYKTTYTGTGRYPSNLFRLRIAKSLLAEINPKPENVLDAGCGDGRVTAELIRDGYACTGFDFSEGMLQEARAVLEQAGVPGDVLCFGDIYDIPRDDHSVDALLCLGVLPNLENHEKIFKNFRRVLKDGGHILISLENDLFNLFSLNSYTVDFYNRLMTAINVPAAARAAILDTISEKLGSDAPSVSGVMMDATLDKSGVTVDKYNPLNLNDILRQRGFELEALRYYHYHPAPPQFEAAFPELFQNLAQSLETPQEHWIGGILCNVMVLRARKLP